MNTIQSDSTKVTWSQVYNDFKGALDGAADALKTGAEHVYEILVRQQMVNSVSTLIVYVLLGAICFITWKSVLSFLKKKRSEEANLQSYEKGEWGYLYILPCAVSLLTIAVFAATITSTITGFVNPEYGAIQDLLEFVRK